MTNENALKTRGVVSARSLLGRFPDSRTLWGMPALAGRLAELSGSGPAATLTLAFSLVLDAQKDHEPVAWITLGSSTFYPPDAAAGGIDLDALVVVRVSELRHIFRTADHLVRSGAFGLIVLDLGAEVSMPLAVQTRLAGLASRYGSGILCLTEKKSREPALGSLISLRGDTLRERIGRGEFLCRLKIVKDKRLGPGREHAESFHGPDGLC